MSKVKAGIHRLYDAMGCSISSQEETKVIIPNEDFTAVIYIGPNPVYGIPYDQSQNGKYHIPGETTILSSFEYKNAAQSSYPGKFFTEITFLKEYEVDEDIYNSYITDGTHARDVVLDRARQDEFQLKKMVDVLAGTIGLRFHCQFVMKIITEVFITIKNDDVLGISYSSPGVQILENVTISSRDVQKLEQLLLNIGQTSSKELDHGSKAMGWLLRAWVEQNIISKFVFLFIALEVILGKIHKGESQINYSATRIKKLIKVHSMDYKEEDIKYFDMAIKALNQQPISLTDRFEILANKAHLPGWENDVYAFRNFNRIRNYLFHQGDSRLKLQIEVNENQVSQLQNLAERYVSVALFGDGVVYPSIYRARNTM